MNLTCKVKGAIAVFILTRPLGKRAYPLRRAYRHITRMSPHDQFMRNAWLNASGWIERI